ncbi:MAG: hypothetical protein LBQ43_03690 [Holosporales bacterium]|jgi:hypothetical protein|nr:hypothetical protein [Holosporales bacterium]
MKKQRILSGVFFSIFVASSAFICKAFCEGDEVAVNDGGNEETLCDDDNEDDEFKDILYENNIDLITAIRIYNLFRSG